jgi:hypothetical protein
MKKITNEIKAKIFAMYYNQMYESDGYEYCLTGERLDNVLCGEISKLILKPLSMISDEDAIEVTKIVYGTATPTQLILIKEGIKDFFEQKWNIGLKEMAKVLQYLQSKGYALPYGDYSVEDLVGLGVIKLK